MNGPIEQLVDMTPDADRERRLEQERTRLRIQHQAKQDVQAERRASAHIPSLRAIGGADLPSASFPPRKALLQRGPDTFVYAGQIIEFFSTRGFGKTWLLMTFALLMSAGEAMGFKTTDRRRVLYIDGEMARHDIQDRLNLLSERTGLPLTDHLVIVAADWQDEFLPRLDTLEGQAAIEPFVDQADVIIFDNRGCLFDPEGEKDPAAWQPAADYLLSLRRRDKTSILGHHANRQGGARGIGKPEDQMDLVGKLVHPDDYHENDGARFTVSFAPPDGKARGLWGEAVTPFTIRFTAQGWELEQPPNAADLKSDALRNKAIAMLCALEKANEKLPTSANEFQKLMGGNRAANLALWAELKASKVIIPNGSGGMKLSM